MDVISSSVIDVDDPIRNFYIGIWNLLGRNAHSIDLRQSRIYFQKAANFGHDDSRWMIEKVFHKFTLPKYNGWNKFAIICYIFCVKQKDHRLAKTLLYSLQQSTRESGIPVPRKCKMADREALDLLKEESKTGNAVGMAWYAYELLAWTAQGNMVDADYPHIVALQSLALRAAHMGDPLGAFVAYRCSYGAPINAGLLVRAGHVGLYSALEAILYQLETRMEIAHTSENYALAGELLIHRLKWIATSPQFKTGYDLGRYTIGGAEESVDVMASSKFIRQHPHKVYQIGHWLDLSRREFSDILRSEATLLELSLIHI